MSQAKDRQKKRELKRAKRSLKHKAFIKESNASKIGVKRKAGKAGSGRSVTRHPGTILRG